MSLLDCSDEKIEGKWQEQREDGASSRQYGIDEAVIVLKRLSGDTFSVLLAGWMCHVPMSTLGCAKDTAYEFPGRVSGE